ncbi:hypothetical protein [Treponema sp.]|uniref:hypothetical protein n=1 Tax=Treponema sp. TaxID=166 RepID=UPI0038902FEA
MIFQSTEIEAQGRRFALQVTAAFFLFLVILCLAVRIKPKEKYHELAIRLDSVPVVKEKAAASKKPDPVKTEKKVQESQEKKVETPKKQENKPSPTKKAEKKSEPEKKKAVAEDSKQKFEEPKLKKSVDELMAENRTARKKVEFDESLFADSNEPVQTKESTVTRNVAVAKSSLSGSSATAETKKASGASSSSASSNASDNSVSDSTRDALSDIKNTLFSSTVAEGIKSKSNIQASRSPNGAVSMQMSDGSARQLLYPKSPSIMVSEENARLIDTTRNVKITFTVKPDGSVPFGGIQITPGASIPAAIQKEIKEQIMAWKFSEDASGRNATAAFNYSLEIK